jgi:aquaporin related protein
MLDWGCCIAGSIFNPNVSLALLLTGVIKPVRFILVCIAQFVASIAAASVTVRSRLRAGDSLTRNILETHQSRHSWSHPRTVER